MGWSKSQDIKTNYNGYTFYYRYSQHKTSVQDPILFISGAFQDMDSWKLISDHFASNTTTILVDLPGTGKADTLPNHFGFNFITDAMHYLLNEIGINKVYIIAASYGTPIAYNFAQKYQHRVSKLVLAGTMIALTDHLKELITTSIEIANKGIGADFASYVLENGLIYNQDDAEEKIRRHHFVKRVLYRQLRLFNESLLQKYNANSRRLLSEHALNIASPPKVKTLVFTGEYDVFTTPNACQEVAKAFEDSLFTTIKNADHLFHLQQTKTTIALLSNFGNNNPLNTIEGCNEIQLNNKHQKALATH